MIGDLARPYNMAEALAGVDAVIHTAGLAGTMSGVPEDDYRLFNTEATVGFAKAAQRARIKRFVFLSSIRAQSGPTAEGILTEDREPRPTDAYGRSKLAAEQGLAETDLDWVALRLVLVYGPGVEGNMARLIKLARSPYPLPLAGLRSEHSLLGLDNLVEAIDKVLAAEPAAEAPVHRRRPETPDHRRDDRGHAPGPRPAPGVVLRAQAAAQSAHSARQDRPKASRRSSALSSPTQPRSAGSTGCRRSRPKPDSLRFFAAKPLRDAASQCKRDKFVQCEARDKNCRKLNPKVVLDFIRGLTFVAISCYGYFG